MSFDNRSSTMDGNGGNPETQSQAPLLCKMGCGFYGNPINEGLCSKCHKDKAKRLQEDKSSTPTTARGASAAVQNDARSLSTLLSSSGVELASSSSKNAVSEESGGVVSEFWDENVADIKVVTNSITERDSSESTSSVTSNVESKTPSPDATSTTAESDDSATGKPKRNRCLECNKKVGLTGFGCRCGGLFCSVHRYSDKHNCQFDYKEHAQDQIRKNNPIVVGNKITKL